jgi:hypothetical protein
MMAVSGTSRLLRTGLHVGPITGVELPKKIFTSRAR